MGVYSTKSKWQTLIQPLVGVCIRSRVHPDLFTYAALGLSGIAAAAFILAANEAAWLWLVPACVLTRLLLNLMDGQVARALGVADDWGEVKNEFGDRLADAFVFAGLGLSGYVEARLALIALALILCVSYLGILGKAVGLERLYSGLFGKGDRMISLAIFSLYPLLTGDLAAYNWYLGLAALAAAITAVQRLHTLRKRLHSQTK